MASSEIENPAKDIWNESYSSDNCPLLACQNLFLRLRHLSQIIGCNLTLKNGHSCPLPSSPLPTYFSRKPFNKGFCISLEAQNKVFFTSELQTSNNPKWNPFDLSLYFPIELLCLKGIVISVWLKDEDPELIKIVSWSVCFSGLFPLPPNMIISHKEFKPNSLIFKLANCYYICPQSTSLPVKTFLCHSINLPLSETKPSCSVSSLCRLHAMKRRKRLLENRCEVSKKSLEQIGIKEHSLKISLQRKIEDLRMNISTLNEFLAEGREKLKLLQEEVDNQSIINNDKGVELMDYYQALQRRWNYLKTEDKAHYNENLNLLYEITAKVKERRRHLLSHLPLIFPINQYNKEKLKFTICGIYLPHAEKFEGQSPQSLSVSIGYASQLICNISHVLNIPLRFPITSFGSLSSIADLTSTQLQEMSKSFQLYTRGKEKERLHFDYAVFLLNKNIAQLRWCCGLNTQDLRQTLYNLWTLLFNVYSNAAFCRAIMPDTLVSLPYITDKTEKDIETPLAFLQHQNVQAKVHSCLENSLLKFDSLSLNHSPSSPKKTIINKKLALKKNRLNSNPESISFSDSNQSDNDADSKGSFIPQTKCENLKNYLRDIHLRPENELSQSLDQGLDSICGKGVVKPHNTPTSLCVRVDSAVSYPDLSVEETCPSDFRDETTQILRSWHENEPSPYSSIIASNSNEALDNGEVAYKKVDIENEIISLELNESLPYSTKENLDDPTKSFSGIEEESQAKDYAITKDATPKDKKLTTLSGQNIIDPNLDTLNHTNEEKFLNEVSFRTAALAKQNCSFKISFTKQPTQE